MDRQLGLLGHMVAQLGLQMNKASTLLVRLVDKSLHQHKVPEMPAPWEKQASGQPGLLDNQVLLIADKLVLMLVQSGRQEVCQPGPVGNPEPLTGDRAMKRLVLLALREVCRLDRQVNPAFLAGSGMVADKRRRVHSVGKALPQQ